MGFGSADYLHTITEAMKLAYADRDTYYADPDIREDAEEGLLSKAYAKERATADRSKARVAVVHRGRSTPYDSTVKQWPYWKADVSDQRRSRGGCRRPGAVAHRSGRDSAGVSKDTTHMAIIDKDGNIFDVTPSGGWVTRRRDPRRHRNRHERARRAILARSHPPAQIRPRARPSTRLTPSMVFKGDVPMMGIGTPGGDNQDQTILQAFLSVVEFWNDWYPNLHVAFERPRVQTLHFYGSFWPHTADFNKLNVEGAFPIPFTTNLKPAATTSAGCACSACPAARPRS